MATLTKPIILDETGQDIVTALNALTVAVNSDASEAAHSVSKAAVSATEAANSATAAANSASEAANSATTASSKATAAANSATAAANSASEAATATNIECVAPIESTTASQAYTQGDHFLKDGKFCTVTRAIASGGTLTKNTNYTEGDVGEAIADLYSNIGFLTTPVPAMVANHAPCLKRNITNAFYNGSLRSEIAAGNFKNVRPGDYIIGQATGSTYYVAECDWWLGLGDNTNNTNYPSYGTHHLGLMLYKAVGTTKMWAGYGYTDKSWRVSTADLSRCPWNAATDVDPTDTEAVGSNDTNITRTYNSASVSAYMGSFIRERIDEILLPECFQADFGSANVLKRRNMLTNAVDTATVSGADSSWKGRASSFAWYDRYIDLPSEVEIYGTVVAGSSYRDVGVQCEQLSLFKNARIHDFFPRMDIWTKAVASSTNAGARSYYGYAFANSASSANWACPLAAVR